MDTNEVLLALGDSWQHQRGPLYQRLATAFRDAIRRGDLGQPTRIPSERDLARLLGVSRTTVGAAYSLLRQEGLVDSTRGSGTRVSASGLGFVPGVARPSLRFLGDLGSGIIDCAAASVAEVDDLPRESLVVPEEEVRRIVASFVYEPFGLPELREVVAERYSRHGLPTRPEEILITTGAQQAVALLFALFGRDRGTLLVENPTYVGALDGARAVGASSIGVRTVDGALDLGDLEDKLKRVRARALYLMTTCQNPTGALMSHRRRQELMALAESAGTPVIDDMTLSDLLFDGESTIPYMASLGSGTVVTIGSLSKLYWPGVRVGWTRATAPLIRRLGRLKVVWDLGSSHFSQILATRLVVEADSFAISRRAQLKERFELFAGLIRKELPDWRFTSPRGGPFLWVSLPRGDGDAFAGLALRHGVQVLPGSKMSPDGSMTDHLRISYVRPPEELRVAVERLGQAWEAFDSGADIDPLGVVV